MDDNALLQEYARTGRESAFATLVQRHVALVYSAARRQVGDPQYAEDVTQAVFVVLARKAGQVAGHPALSGWLLQTTRYAANAHIRAAARRTQREQEAAMQSDPNDSSHVIWEQLEPQLDEAMASLGATDRAVLALRFFENKTAAETGQALNLNEEAAKKRTHRALEKLRKFFAHRGVAMTATAMAGAMAANSVQAAPAALAKTVTAVALTKGATAGGSTLTLIKEALKIMAWTKMKTAILIGAGVLLAAGTATVTTKEIQEHRSYSWQVPKADFSVFYKSPPMVKILPTKFSEEGSWCCDGGRGAMGIAQPLKTIVQVAYQTDPLRVAVVGDLPTEKFDFLAKLVPAQEAHKKMPTDAHWAAALQQEIRRKFGVAGRMEARETDVLLLEYKNPAAHGFQPADSLRQSLKLPKGTAIRPGPGQFEAFNQPIGTLAAFLQRRMQVPILDRTGLASNSDYIVKWNEPDSKQPDNEALKQALSSQLGLELTPSRQPLDMLVVEKVR